MNKNSAIAKDSKESKAANPTKPVKDQGKVSQVTDKKASGKPNKPAAAERRHLVGTVLTGAEAVMAFGEIVSLKDAHRIALMDGNAKTWTDAPQAYATANEWQYYFGINIWYHVVYDSMLDRDPRGIAARTLLHHINTKGLLCTIAACCDTAQRLVQEKYQAGAMDFLITDDLAGSLQRLRFLKRFTALETNLLFKKNQEDWLKVEKACRSYNRRNYVLNTRYDYYVLAVKDILADWLKGYKPVEVDDNLPPLPTGATYELRDGRSLTLVERAQQYVRRAHNGRRFIFLSADPKWQTPVEDKRIEMRTETGGWQWSHCATDSWQEKETYRSIYSNHRETVYTGWSVRDTDGEPVVQRTETRFYEGYVLTRPVRRYWVAKCKRYNRLLFVPKTYKSSRTVCPESPLNQMMQRKIRDHLVDCVPKWVRKHLPLEDQRVMESMAAVAFRLGLTTTDLSHASDSLSLKLVIDVMPSWVKEDLLRWRPTHTMLEGNVEHPLEQFSTMGTGNVWYVMALVLLATMVAACDLVRVPEARRNAVFAFGDDLIHPDEITECLYDMLSVFGFTVNADKSYGGPSRYRESCGSEWWLESDGSVTSLRTLYFPRFPIAQGGKVAKGRRDYDVSTDSWSVRDGLSRLIGLQHQLYYDAPSAAEFISRAVKRVMPEMTTSVAGDVCDDLWGEFADGPVKRVAGLYGDTEENGKRTYMGDTPMYHPELGKEVPADTRVGHMRLTVGGGGRKAAEPIVREWDYLMFLKSGPAPASDDLLALCGMTEARTLIDPLDLTVEWKVRF